MGCSDLNSSQLHLSHLYVMPSLSKAMEMASASLKSHNETFKPTTSPKMYSLCVCVCSCKLFTCQSVVAIQMTVAGEAGKTQQGVNEILTQ